jgi:hypothetical protein
MAKYAQGTEVPATRSRIQIEETLMRAGASAFAYGVAEEPHAARIMCDFDSRRIRIDVPLPRPGERDFTHTPTGLRRAEAAARQEYDREIRRRWRALLLIVKAKLEAVASGITTFEEEFLAHIVLPDGRTFFEWARPQLAMIYGRSAMPALLSGVSSD